MDESFHNILFKKVVAAALVTFTFSSLQCNVLTGYLSMRRRPGSDWANM